MTDPDPEKAQESLDKLNEGKSKDEEWEFPDE